MRDDELDYLLEAWSQQTRLSPIELDQMLARVTEEPAGIPFVGDAGGQWIAFWQQIGQSIRQQQRAGLAVVGLLGISSEVGAG